MPAIVKLNSAMSNGLALVSYSVRKTAGLNVVIDAEFVAAASANVDLSFGAGATVPSVLANNANYQALISSSGASAAPTLTDVSSSVRAGLKTINASYVTTARPTVGSLVFGGRSSSVGGIVIPADQGTADEGIAAGASDSGDTETSVGVQVGGGSGVVQYETASSLKSLSGTYSDTTTTQILGEITQEEVALSFSFNYYSTQRSITSSSPEQVPSQQFEGSVSEPFNVQGTIPRSLVTTEDITTFRTSTDSKGGYRHTVTTFKIYKMTGTVL